MRKLLLFFFTLCCIGIFIFIYKNDIINYVYFSPCDSPIHYKIGAIDQKFNLTEDQFATDIQDATALWNQLENKQLFTYDPAGTLTISMVYDGRQTLNNQINTLGTQLQTEKKTISPALQQYTTLSNDFKQRMAALNSKIAYWNTQGGAPPSEYKQLTEEQGALQRQANQLNQMAQVLNQSTDTYNAHVGQLNQTVDTLNSALQAKPEEGLYNPQNNTITIYFNNGHAELVHTVAHELGHALGMNHNPDSRAIMYFQTNDIITPAPEDIAALQVVCKKRTIFDPLITQLQTIITTYMAK